MKDEGVRYFHNISVKMSYYDEVGVYIVDEST